MLRSQMLDKLSHYIQTFKVRHPLRVAIDGIDASGKSRLAKELVFPLRRTGRQIIQLSIDDFQHPREYRYRRGAESPEGYYYDSFNYQAVLENVLIPLGPEGNRQFRGRLFDLDRNELNPGQVQTANNDAILLFDGVFLMRPELFDHWDIRIFIDIFFETSIERAIQRDVERFDSVETIRRRYQNRYIPGQKIYFERCHPKQRADVVIENDDVRNPVIHFQRAVAG